MSLLPEVVIQEVIAKGIRELKAKPWKFHQLFRNIPQVFNEQVYRWFKDTLIDIELNFPRKETAFPCIIISLRGEQESHTFVGDVLGAGYDVDDLNIYQGDELFFTEGISEHKNTLEQASLGESRKLFNKSNNIYLEQRGSFHSTSYAIQVQTGDKDHTVFLYHALKYILSSHLMEFERNGMLNVSFGGSDFTPKVDAEPTFVYIRMITMSFMYLFDYVVDPHQSFLDGIPGEEQIAKAVSIHLEGAENEGTFNITLTVPPQLRNIWSLDRIDEWGYHFDESPQSIRRGTLTENLVAEGINLSADSEITIYGDRIISAGAVFGFPGIPGELFDGAGTTIPSLMGEGSTTVPVVQSVSGKAQEKLGVFGSIINNIAFFKYPGSLASSASVFQTSFGERVPNAVEPGMWLQVVDPHTAPNFGEICRISYVTNSSVVVSGGFSSSLSGVSVRVLTLSTDISILDEIVNEKFFSSQPGQQLSSLVRFVAGLAEDIPTSILKGMYLQVTGPIDSKNYKQLRRISDVTVGAGGKITVSQEFSESLAGCTVRVVEYQNFLKFSVYAPPDCTVGKYNVKIVSKEGLEYTLMEGLTVV